MAKTEASLLLVDDDDTVAVGLAGYLKAQGWEVDTAHDFMSGRRFAGSRRYEIVVVDVVATGECVESGMGFLQWLRDRSPETIPMVLTAYRTAWVDDQALSLGVTHVLDKPRSFAEVAGLIAAVLAKAALLGDARQ